MKQLATAMAVAMLLSLPAMSAGHDWPNFMGPAFNHKSLETGWASKWSASGPKVAWSADVGKGYSAVSVVGDRAWTLGWKDGKETVYCFNAATGDVIWTHGYKAQLIPTFHLGGPNAAPTVHNGKVYTLSKDGQLFCLDAVKGTVVWRLDVLKEFGLPEMTRWGFASAPVIDGSQILLHSSTILSVDIKTGKTNWIGSDKFKPGYGSIAPFAFKGRKLAAALNGESLVVFDRTNGKLVAKHPFKVQYNTNCITPMVTNNGSEIFIAASNDSGRCQKLTFDGKGFKEIYRNEVMRNFMQNSILVDGYLYGVDGKHKKRRTRLVCMRYSDGKMMWEHNGLGCGTLIASDGKLIILSETGELLTAPISSKAFTPISRAKLLEGTCWTPPVLAHGRIYIRNDVGKLLCVDLRK